MQSICLAANKSAKGGQPTDSLAIAKMRHGLKVSAQMATLTVRVEEQTEFNHSEKHGNNNFYELSISHTITAALASSLDIPLVGSGSSLYRRVRLFLPLSSTRPGTRYPTHSLRSG